MEKALHGICTQPKSNIFTPHMDSEDMIANTYSLHLILALLTAGEFGCSVCVIWLREFEKLVF